MFQKHVSMILSALTALDSTLNSLPFDQEWHHLTDKGLLDDKKLPGANQGTQQGSWSSHTQTKLPPTANPLPETPKYWDQLSGHPKASWPSS